MGKTAICSESLSNLTCQSIWLSKPQLISLPLIESSAYGKTDPQTTLKTHKILPEKQVAGSISFTGESPPTGILLHQDFFNSIALLFIQKYSFCNYHFIPIENDDATTYMLIYLTISYIFQKKKSPLLLLSEIYKLDLFIHAFLRVLWLLSHFFFCAQNQVLLHPSLLGGYHYIPHLLILTLLLMIKQDCCSSSVELRQQCCISHMEQVQSI